MADEPDVEQVAAVLRVSLGLLVRRLGQVRAHGDLTLPESSALARLDRGGPATATVLARRSRSARSRWAPRSYRRSKPA